MSQVQVLFRLPIRTECGVVVKFGYNAGLSRRRAWVQIPSAPPVNKRGVSVFTETLLFIYGGLTGQRGPSTGSVWNTPARQDPVVMNVYVPNPNDSAFPF